MQSRLIDSSTWYLSSSAMVSYTRKLFSSASFLYDSVSVKTHLGLTKHRFLGYEQGFLEPENALLFEHHLIEEEESVSLSIYEDGTSIAIVVTRCEISMGPGEKQRREKYGIAKYPNVLKLV